MADSYKQIIELQAKTAKAARDIDRFVREAQKKISSLEGVLEGKTAKGAARRRPLSVEERRKTARQIAAEKVLIKLRQDALEVQKTANSVATASLSKQLRLNAATERRNNLLKALKRAGVSGDRAKEVQELKKVAEANSKNVGILNDTNNALVKILETQREITRTDIAQDRVARKNAEGKQLDKRVKQLKAVGASKEALEEIEEERLKLAGLNGKKQTDLARKQLAQVEELIRAQEELNKAYLQPTKQIASPIRGTTGMVGSPKYLEQQQKDAIKRAKELDKEENRINKTLDDRRKLRERAAKAAARLLKEKIKEGGPSSPIRGTETMVGSPKYMAAEAKRLNKEELLINKTLDDRRKIRAKLAREAKNQADAAAKQRKTKTTDILTGAGFPLLFGGGPGATLGGLAGGVVGGFGGSIALSALGAQFDKTGETAKRLAASIKDPIQLLDELTTAGFQVSDSLKEQVKNLNDQGLVLDAANLAIEEFTNKIGNKGVKELQNFDAATDELREQLAKTSLIIFSEFVPAISAVTKIITSFVRNLTGPELQRLAANADPAAFERARTSARQQSQGRFFGGDPVKYEQILTAESRKILARSAAPVLDSDEQNRLAKAQQKSLNINSLELQILKDKLDIINSSGDILDENVFLAEQKLIINKAQLAIEKAGNDKQAIKVAKATQELELAQLTKRRRQEQLRIEQRITEEMERRQEAEMQAYNQAKNSLFIAEGQLAVSKVGNDLTKDAVYQAQRDLINRRASIEIGKAENDAAKDLAETNEQIALNNLDRSRDEAIRNAKLQGLQAELSISQKIVDVNKKLVDAGQKGLIEPELFSRFEKSVGQKTIDQQVKEVGEALRSAGDRFTQEDISILENYYRAALTREQELQEMQTKRAELLDEISKKQAAQDVVERFIAPIKEIREQQEQSLQTQKDYNRLLLEGVLPTEARRLAQFNEQVRIQTALIEAAIAQAEAKAAELKDNEALTKEYQAQLDLINALKEARGEVVTQAAKGPGPAAPDQDPKAVIAGRIGQLEEELKTMTNLGNVAVTVADNIGGAFSTAFQSVVSGSKSTQEALSDMFKTIAEDFLSMAAEIIAKQLIMITLQTILKALGAVAGASSGGGDGLNIDGVQEYVSEPFNASDYTNAFSAKAKGGPVNSNTPYIVGEEGPELFIPGTSGLISNNDQFEAARAALIDEGDFTAEEAAAIEKLGTSQEPGQLNQVLRDSRSAVQSITRLSKEREIAGVNQLTKEIGAAAVANTGSTLSGAGSSTTTNNLKEVLGGDSSTEKVISAIQQAAQAEAVTAARDALIQAGDEQGAELLASEQAAGSNNSSSVTNTSREYIEKLVNGSDAGSNNNSSVTNTSREYIQNLVNGSVAGGANTVNNINNSSTLGDSRTAVDRVTALNQTRQMLESVSSVNKERDVERVMESTANGNVKPLDVRYESQVINNVEYVTAEQHRRGLAEAAERGRAITLQTLQNSVKSRRRLGLA